MFNENGEPGKLVIVEVPGLESEKESTFTPALETPT